MADIEPPSFSLGLDFDLEPEPEPESETPHHPPISATHKSSHEELEDAELWVSDSEPDSDPTPTRLRRLRRGPPSNQRVRISHDDVTNDDDDIQEFSSEELPNTAPQHHSLCSSSKLPLSRHGILESQQQMKVANNGKRKQDSSCPSTSLNASRGKSVFVDLTSSPLRKFRLLDSDSDVDDLSESVHIGRDANGLCLPKLSEQKESTQGCHRSACKEKINSSTPFSRKQDLWQDFYAEKSTAIPTPALDEFMKEYSKTSKERNQLSRSSPVLGSSVLRKGGTTKMTQSQDSGYTNPPSHRYFCHDDLRIQSLVCSRLPYFHPLGASSQEANNSPIDYMNQFGHADGAKQPTARQANVRKSAGRTRKKSKKSDFKDTPNVSGVWVNPKQAGSCPKDASRRRVCADGQSSGHWLTGENGRKVYITKTGQELTGRLAYKNYKQDTGRGRGRSKKKPGSKKK